MGLAFFWVENGVSSSPDGRRWAAIPILIVVGLLLVTPRFEPRLICAGPPRLLALSYQRRFFLRMAWANAAVLVGFIVGMETGTWWTYPLTVLAAAPAFRRAMPSDHRIAKEQARLDASGCHLELLDALLERPS